MNSKLRSILKWFFLIWGVLSFVLLVLATGLFLFRLSNIGGVSAPKVGLATAEDVRFVLNWCRLGDARTEKVVNSYVSPRSFTGDHVDAYAIKVRNLTLTDLSVAESSSDGGWVRCDQLDPISREAVRLATGMSSSEVPWFPNAQELESPRYYLWIWSISIHGRSPIAAQLIFARPDDSMIFYSSVKT